MTVSQQNPAQHEGAIHVQPLVEELFPTPHPVDAFQRFRHLPHCLFLDSAAPGNGLGRYTFLAADPIDWVTVPAGQQDGLSNLRQKLSQWMTAGIPELPPFQGGAAGLFGFDLGRPWENVPGAAYDEFQVPSLCIGFYDVVVMWDHDAQRSWIVSTGIPEPDPGRRKQRAAERLHLFRQCLTGDDRSSQLNLRPSQNESTVDIADLSPQHSVDNQGKITSNFSRAGYLQTVQRAIDYIHAGDIFQVNLSQRLLHPAEADAADLYLRLRQCNPAPFAGYLDTGSVQIVSASPERFLQVQQGRVEARPIKGTRPRNPLAEADLFSGDELQQSEKDRSENVMIVDLLRNDLARVCSPESVRVTQLCEVERFAYVQHLVSAIEGSLASDHHPLDLIRATFPGGSITGAPKVRAMQIISELEPNARGAYCGSLGYIGYDGTMDLNILIRTITVAGGWWQMPVGGGIVAQSDPLSEYEETWHKAEGLLKAL